MGITKDERAQLSDLFDQVGPDVPTLCDGWLTRDLAAHLVVRERRPDAAIGIVVKPLAGYLENVQGGYADKPWRELVDLFRAGPPPLSPYRPAIVDELVNTTEFFVHHEDVRRARPGWQPRPADAKRDEAVWRAVRASARVLYRRSPVGVVLRRPDGTEHVARSGRHSGERAVTVIGEPAELMLHAYGRDAIQVELAGDPADVSALTGASRGF
ncbi:MAG: TIGR03085 family metal-binding protein [Actinomycetota bacterium]|nr:TIGR03085 family metal-binding protein [Actinomycetota bacterium]